MKSMCFEGKYMVGQSMADMKILNLNKRLATFLDFNTVWLPQGQLEAAAVHSLQVLLQ